jgi:hypothetical protein
MDRDWNSSAGRLCVLAGVIAIHAAGVVLLTIELRKRPVASKPVSGVSQIFFVPVQPRSRVKSEARRRQPVVPIARNTETRALDLATANSDVNNSITDWEAERALSATAIADELQNPKHRPLESRPKASLPKPEVHKPGMFDRGPAHKPGTVENLGEGMVRIWVDHYCYRIGGIDPHTGRPNGVTCRGRPVKQSATLDEFIPRYLKAPLPVAKATIERTLPAAAP